MTEVLRAGRLRVGLLMLDQMFGFHCTAAVVGAASGTAESRRTDRLIDGWTVEANKALLGSHHFKATSLNVCLKKSLHG